MKKHLVKLIHNRTKLLISEKPDEIETIFISVRFRDAEALKEKQQKI